MAMKLREAIKADEQATPAEPPARAMRRRTAAPAKAVSPARDGKKAVVGYFDPKVSDRLRILSVESGRTVQDLVGIGINRVLAEYGKKPFAELEPE